MSDNKKFIMQRDDEKISDEMGKLNYDKHSD